MLFLSARNWLFSPVEITATASSLFNYESVKAAIDKADLERPEASEWRSQSKENRSHESNQEA
jgi:hypothetical protein